MAQRKMSDEFRSKFEDYEIPALMALYHTAQTCNSGSLYDFRDLIIEKYLELNEDARQYATGDMDMKDTEIKEMIAEKEEEAKQTPKNVTSFFHIKR